MISAYRRTLNPLTEQFVSAAQKSLLFDFIARAERANDREPIYVGVDELLHSLAFSLRSIYEKAISFDDFSSTGKLCADRRWRCACELPR